MAKIKNKTEFKDYCLRKLGEPVIKVNVHPEQISDRIDEAIQYWQEFHSDATYRTFFRYQIKESDIKNGDGKVDYIQLPDNIFYVNKMLKASNSFGSSGMFNLEYQLHLNDIFDLRVAGSMTNYYMSKSYIEMISMMFNNEPLNEFQRHGNKLHIVDTLGDEIKVGDWVVLDVTMLVDTDTTEDVWNDIYLKRYATALIKKQWGINLSKFSDMQLPGGVSFNGAEILSEAHGEIEKLEEELRMVWERPLSIFIG